MKSIKDIKKIYPAIVSIMRLAAIKAGTEILDVYKKDDFGIEFKEDESPLTIADSRADQVIVDILSRKFPEIPVVSEESHSDLDAAIGGLYFLVDPLDGTKEFIKMTGEFTVNIALILNGKAELGVVFVPEKQDLYYRDFDGFSRLEREVNVLDDPKNTIAISCKLVDLKNLTVVRSESHFTSDTKAYISRYEPKNLESGGSSLKFCLVARGTADLYPRLGRTMEWDTGAAHAVLKGAGGNVFQLDTLNELVYGKPGRVNAFFVAASNEMHLIPHDGSK